MLFYLLPKEIKRKDQILKNIWKQIISIMYTDAEFSKYYDLRVSYINAVYIGRVERIKNRRSSYNPLDENLRDATKQSIYYRYIETNVYMNADTFKEAIENKNYIENECWINTIYDFYKDTLLSDKRRKHISRETILNDIGITEETIKHGISLNKIVLFFQKYNLQLRVFDIFKKLIFKYDPERVNFHNKPMFCMIKGNHVYTLNHNVKSLQQKYDNDDSIIVRASPNYRINENKQVHEYKMIESVNDVLRIVQTTEDEKQIINLICKDDKLTEMLYELIEAGYEPSIKYQAGKLTHINLKLGKIMFMMKTQQLVPDSLDGMCSVSSEIVYNNMNQAMTLFHTQLFKNDHKSFYTHQDITILDEYRSIVPLGRLIEGGINLDLVELDISKAFSAAFKNIHRIPIFNIFDTFKPYHNQQIKSLTLYIVFVKKHNLFLNKEYNLIYGQFLDFFKEDVEIL